MKWNEIMAFFFLSVARERREEKKSNACPRNKKKVFSTYFLTFSPSFQLIITQILNLKSINL